MRHVIFPAGPDDAEALARVHVDTWRETYRGLLPDGFLSAMSIPVHAARFERGLTRPGELDATLAAADRSGLVGYAMGGPSRARRKREAEIHTLYVLRRAQGFGLGRRLLTDLARVMADLGAESLLISVLRDNANARAFYEHLGGQPEPARPEHGPGGVMYEVAYRWPEIGALLFA